MERLICEPGPMLARQLPLFEEARAVRRGARPRRAHVLSDPKVAESVARRSSLGCDLRSAFVSFWSSLPPERRAELRARLAA